VPAERRAANAVALRALFESLVRELTAALESLAVTEFNAWLVGRECLSLLSPLLLLVLRCTQAALVNPSKPTMHG
jgi:hypothetical protein